LDLAFPAVADLEVELNMVAETSKLYFPAAAANRYRIGMWVAIAAILMMFTALSSAYIVRAASANDWQALTMPRILWLSTILIVVSSGALEVARRKWKGAIGNNHKPWLLFTFALGTGFLISQLLAWRELARQGVYVASHPHSSFFYLLSATHAVHLLGGLAALAFISVRPRVPQEDRFAVARAQGSADAVALYWHFMALLWLYLFVLLFFVR
jgi:cytochrome c oxidase subunit 3